MDESLLSKTNVTATPGFPNYYDMRQSLLYRPAVRDDGRQLRCVVQHEGYNNMDNADNTWVGKFVYYVEEY